MRYLVVLAALATVLMAGKCTFNNTPAGEMDFVCYETMGTCLEIPKR